MEQWSEKTTRTVFLIFCALVALTGLWFNMEPYACPVPAALLTTDAKPPCFDFWLNRYQTLVSSIFTLGAAWYAGFWVAKQIRRTDRQIALSRAQLSSDYIDRIDQRRKNTEAFMELIKKIQRHVARLENDFEPIFQAMEEIAKLEKDGNFEENARVHHRAARFATSNARDEAHRHDERLREGVADLDLEGVASNLADEFWLYRRTIYARNYTLYRLSGELRDFVMVNNPTDCELGAYKNILVSTKEIYTSRESYPIAHFLDRISAEIQRLRSLAEYATQLADTLIVDD